MHLDFEQTVTRARLASTALDVKRESSGAVAAHFCILRRGEQVTDIVEHAGIGCRVGTRRTSDGRLVDIDDLIQILHALNGVERTRSGLGTVQISGQLLVQNLVDERRLARTGHTGHTGECTERNGKIGVL